MSNHAKWKWCCVAEIIVGIIAIHLYFRGAMAPIDMFASMIVMLIINRVAAYYEKLDIANAP